MRLCTTHPVVRRIWTVELRPEHGGTMLNCLQCSPSAPSMRTAPSQALTHLAAHARHDFLPRHLRTCQCHSHGCRWHPRHRGCSGPVLLVLTRERGGRLWRLADTCAACAAATAHAAVVPDTVLATASPAESVKRIRQRQRRRTSHGPSEQVRVREMLSYLAAALPARTSAAARLLALQCALRSTTAGKVNIPAGLIRGMRIASEPSAFTELEAAGWLRSPTGPTHAGISVELLDTAVRMQTPARADRARAANWILRTCQMGEIRQLGASPRLLALALAAHLPDQTGAPAAEQEVLARMCGLPLQELTILLDMLVATHFLRSWAHGAAPEDLHWELTRRNHLTGNYSGLESDRVT
ncbi:hypothetical protein CIB93_26415 [Streptomyces sp. WZ.A104]|nr:hypothetical protein CIB93_26415 [Streptomyces sp. WZ.A104]